jgi:galactose mutarotase-like enzyme
VSADGLECESEAVAVRVEPANGAKVTSLLHRPSGRQWLTTPAPGDRRLPSQAVYGTAAAYGWDECFPTIAPGPYRGEGRWAGTELPDHGELWSRPWRVLDTTSSAVDLEASGTCLPFRFRRRIEVERDGVVVHYGVTNDGSEQFSALWAMHPLFALEPGSPILLPGVDGALVVPSPSASALAVDGRCAWPAAIHAVRGTVDLARFGGRSGLAVKLIVEQPPRRVAIGPPQASGPWLGIELPLDLVPHLGVWINEAAWPATPPRREHVALEPTNGLADDLGLAVQAGSGWRLEPREARTWSVALRLGSGESELRAWLEAEPGS